MAKFGAGAGVKLPPKERSDSSSMDRGELERLAEQSDDFTDFAAEGYPDPADQARKLQGRAQSPQGPGSHAPQETSGRGNTPPDQKRGQAAPASISSVPSGLSPAVLTPADQAQALIQRLEAKKAALREAAEKERKATMQATVGRRTQQHELRTTDLRDIAARRGSDEFEAEDTSWEPSKQVVRLHGGKVRHRYEVSSDGSSRSSSVSESHPAAAARSSAAGGGARQITANSVIFHHQPQAVSGPAAQQVPAQTAATVTLPGQVVIANQGGAGVPVVQQAGGGGNPAIVVAQQASVPPVAPPVSGWRRFCPCG